MTKKAKIKAETNLYPDGLPEEKQQRLARRYADIFGALPEAPRRRSRA